VRILTDIVRRAGGDGEVTLWGTPHRAGCVDAVMANGMAVHGFELDDLHGTGGRVHSASVVLAPLLGLAQHTRQVSGRDALVAVVAGVEVGARVGRAMGRNFPILGWHAPYTLGVFPAAAAAGRALRLDAARQEQAFGLAGTQAGGLHASHVDGSMAKRWHAGNASRAGALAALLAQAGFSGPNAVLERPDGGFGAAFTQAPETLELERLTANLGTIWETEAIQYKVYSCRGNCHTTLDAIRELRRLDPLEPAHVRRVTVTCGQLVYHASHPYQPSTTAAAQLSLRYCVAAMLRDGVCFIDQFSDANLRDPELIALSQRVEAVHDPAIDDLGLEHQFQVRAAVELDDGRVLRTEVDQASGGPAHPLSDEELAGKFHHLGGFALPAEQLARIEALVRDLEHLPDVGVLADALDAS
jgi:2-methylcitrate dehydratase PrpD